MNQELQKQESEDSKSSIEVAKNESAQSSQAHINNNQVQQAHALDEVEPNNQENQEQHDSLNSTTKAKTKATWSKFVIGLLVVGLLALIIYGLWKSYAPQPIELQGRVEADTLHVSTKVPSRIEEIYIKEGQEVKKGQDLVSLFSPEIDAKKQQALASLQSALALQSTADRGSQQENIDTLYANWQALKAQQTLAETTYRRGENLYQQGVISRQRRDELRAAAQSSTQMTEASYQQYARAKRGSTSQQKSSADAQVQIAQAAVKEAEALTAETKLLSPIDGIVSKTYGHVSELVAMGVPIVSIIPNEERWVSLNVREDQYADIYKIKTITGYIPALKQNAEFKIENIDIEGEFATIKTTRQTGGYDIRSFKLHLVPTQPIQDLKVGMSVIFKLTGSD